MSPDQMPQFVTRSRLFAVAFFAVLFFLLYQLARIISPYSSAFLWAMILTLALYPLYKKLVRRLKGRSALAAGLMTVTTVLVVIGPAIVLLSVLAAQAVDFYEWVSGLAKSGKLAEEWIRLSGPVIDRFPFLADFDLKGAVINGLTQFSSKMATGFGDMLKNMLLVSMNLFIMLVSLYFFFRNGEAYYHTAMDLLPFSPDHKRSIMQKFQDTFTAVVNGIFLIALLQGFMCGLGFALFGVPFSVFWGVVAAVLALLPVGGAALVWLPGAVYLYLSGTALKALFLFIWGLALVSLPDNILKPMIIGRKARISSFALFISILGGLQVYGFLGILFGPLVITLLSVFVQIYRDEYSAK